MDQETLSPGLPIKHKLPGFLTTVTPLSKAVALIMFTTFPIVGFYLGYQFRPTVQKETTYTKMPVTTATPIPEGPVFKCTENLCIENDTVYYTDEVGQKNKIAESTRREDLPTGPHIYKYAEISPGKNFIYLSGTGWEHEFDEVYEIKTGKIYSSDAVGTAYWLNDERLLVIGGCGMGYMQCGKIYLSIDGKTPWKQKLFAENPIR